MVPTGKAFVLASGALGGSAQISGSNLTLPTRTPNTGESVANSGTSSGAANTIVTNDVKEVAQKIVQTFDGTLTALTITANVRSDSNTWTIELLADSSGTPGTVLQSTPISVGANPPNTDELINFTASGLSWALTGGTSYWIAVKAPASANCFFGKVYYHSVTTSGWSGSTFAYGRNTGAWDPLSDSASSNFYTLTGSYSFTQSGGSTDSGTWTSAVYDSLSTSLTSGMALAVSGTYPTSTSASILVQGSADQSSWTTTDTLSSPNGATSLTGGVYRYWRLVVTVSTTNNLRVPLVGSFVLTFNTTATWTSAPILTTVDCTALVALTANTLVPGGTTATLTIATSASIGSGYSSYTAIGSATPNKYAKIRVTMTADTTDMATPTLLTAELDWTVVSNLISVAIDTGANPPSGWGIFQWDQLGTGGSVVFYFRSASTALGLAGASFLAVTNGGFPTSSVLEFCQWKVVMTANADSIPQVDSVTVNWLLTSGRNVRAASLFFNKSYYLSVATTGNTTNNLLIELDYEGNWRIHSGINIGTMGLYFNDAFYGDSTAGKILSGFALPTDNGTPIAFDLRTKCFDLGNNLALKTIRSCKVTGYNTGTTIHTYYSVDKGATWIEMLNSSGTTGYTTTNDGTPFIEYFIPNFNGVNPTSGATVMFRITSSDAFPCQIEQISPVLYLHKGKAIPEAMA
jgi:hypothetical protein